MLESNTWVLQRGANMLLVPNELLGQLWNFLVQGPTQSPPEPTENKLIHSPATDGDQEKILVCFVMTESFTSFVGLRWPWECCCFLKRVPAVLL